MEEKQKYLRKILNLSIGVVIMITIPLLFGWGFVFLSWLPAILAVAYLDQENINIKIDIK